MYIEECGPTDTVKPGILTPGDQRADMPGPEGSADRGMVIALVGDEELRAAARGARRLRDADRVEERPDVERLVLLPGGRQAGEGDSVAVRYQVELRPKPASRAAQSMVGGLSGSPFLPPEAERPARTIVESTSHTSQSMRPCRSRRICS
jgi:hypothetical protein